MSEQDEIWNNALEARATGEITFEQLKDVAALLLED
jgi:hypothetical protein